MLILRRFWKEKICGIGRVFRAGRFGCAAFRAAVGAGAEVVAAARAAAFADPAAGAAGRGDGEVPPEGQGGCVQERETPPGHLPAREGVGDAGRRRVREWSIVEIGASRKL